MVFYGQEISVELLNDSTLLEPGKAQTLVFRITNSTPMPCNVIPSLVLPKEWGLITKSTQMELKPGQAQLYIATLYLPSQVQAKDHRVEIILTSPSGDLVLQKEFLVNVKKKPSISLQLITSENYVKSGDTIRNSYLLKNNGNITEQIQLGLSNGAFLEQDSIQELLPGQSVELSAYQLTDPLQGQVTRSWIRLGAKSLQDSLPVIYATNSIEIIPLIPSELDAYHRLPIRIATTFLTSDQPGRFKSALQGELYIQGSLDPQQKRKIQIKALGPKAVGLPSFSQYPEYYANYKTNDFYAHIGDKTFSSSILTEYARYGTGVEVEKKFLNKILVRGFYNKPRYFTGIKQEVNIYGQYNWSNSKEAGFGYLQKLEHQDGLISNLYYLRAKSNLSKNIDLQGEYSISERASLKGWAYYLQGQAQFTKWNFSTTYLKASKDYAGYYTNTSVLVSNLSYRILPKLQFNVNYHKDAKNQKQDTLFYAAPYREITNASLRYTYKQNTNATLYVGEQTYEDRMKIKQFDYKERFWQLDLQQRLYAFNIGLQGRWGETTNYLLGLKGNFYNYSTNISYQYRRAYFNVFSSYGQTSRYLEARTTQFIIGVNANVVLSNRWDARIFYQNYHIIEEYFQDRNLLELGVNYRINTISQLELISRYSIGQGQLLNRELNMALHYSVNILAPIKKVVDYGTLKGSVNHEDLSKVEGIKMYLGQDIAIVDANGNFEFKNIVPNSYFLQVDKESLGVNDITNVPFPMRLDIHPNENFINFGITKASNVKGSFLIEDKTLLNQGVSFIVELKNKEYTFRKICSLEHGFDFSYLLPGEWELKIYKNTMGNKVDIDIEKQNITLVANETFDVEIGVRSIKKKVQYLQNTMKVSLNNSKSKK